MKQFADVPSPYGAQMGRRTYCDVPDAKVNLFAVRMVDLAYDDGGVYWGMAGRGVKPLYCARAKGVEIYRRASNRDEAKKIIVAEFPSLRFYR